MGTNWQEVLDVGRADAASQRHRAVVQRSSAIRCANEARDASDVDTGVLWLLREVQQRSDAVSSDLASEVSDQIADHAERVLGSLE
jgi:hypothetical protein